MACLLEKIFVTLAIDYCREAQVRGRMHSVFHLKRLLVPAESNLALLPQSILVRHHLFITLTPLVSQVNL